MKEIETEEHMKQINER